MVNISFQKKNETPAPPTQGKLSFAIFARFFNWFIVVVCIAVLFVGFWFLIRPKYQLVVSDDAINAQWQQYGSMAAYLKELNAIKALYRDVSESDKEKIDTVLSARQDKDALTIALLRDIGYVARLNGAVADNLKTTHLDVSASKFPTPSGPGQEVSPSGVQIVSVTFTLNKVDYTSLRYILNRLEQSLRLIDVTKIDYNPTQRQAEIELYAYHMTKQYAEPRK